jgi:hypothetical protein
MKSIPMLALIATLAVAGCSRPNVAPVARAAVPEVPSAERVLHYPSPAPDAQDGNVMEFY